MCGIAGYVSWDRDLTQESSVLESMVHTLRRRGPDDYGTWTSPRAALGHRRLIVVDPVGGGQPMVRERDGNTYVIVYNGELYNTDEIRDDLKARGWTFKSHSDTEVLLAAYIEWGAECVTRLNGIFAFAIWDDTSNTLFLARDRLGVKPLFYAERPGTLVFGSEQKAVLAHRDVPACVDGEGLAEIFLMGPARTPGLGVFRGILELKPGHCATYSRSGFRPRKYWTLVSRPHEDDLITTSEAIRELIKDIARRQLVSDVPVCSLLSGGLDSSAVTAFAAQAYHDLGLGPVHTYSVDFADNDRHFTPNRYQPDSDGPWIDRVSGLLGTEHHRVVVDLAHLEEALLDAMRARDLPGMADVDSSLLLFSREIKKGATVGLSGESADEIFGGYPWFRDMIPTLAFPWSTMVSRRSALLSKAIRDYTGADNYVISRFEEAMSEVPSLYSDSPDEARIRGLLYLNITRFLPTLLDRKDRMTMACGLEVRVPYCDHRLVEYVWNIPWSMKNAGGMAKGILRAALKGVLPHDVLTRPKSPYPKTHNPAYARAMSERFRGIISDPSSPLRDMLDPDAVGTLLRTDAADFSPSWFGQLMGAPQLYGYLIQADAWFREYHVSVV